MRLLVLFTPYLSIKEWRDIGILTREIAIYKKMAEKGVNIDFLTYGGESDKEIIANLKNLNVVPCKRYINSRFRSIRYFKLLFLPIKEKEVFQNADIIKTNQLYGGIIGCIAKLLYHKTLVIRGGYERFYNFLVQSKRKGIRNLFSYLYNYTKIYLDEYLEYKLADHIILTTKKDIDFIIKSFGLKKKQKKIHLLYNLIDTQLFKPLIVKKEEKSVVYVGRLVDGKNLFNLFKSFINLDDFSLNIVGKGPLKSNLQNFAMKNQLKINFLGVIPNNQLPQILNKNQIFILPSFYEGNPKVLLEAMSCRMACIGTNIKGINNIIQHKINGYLCEPDYLSIKKAILEIYNDEALREKIGNTAREFIQNNCDLKIIFNKEYRIYNQMLKERLSPKEFEI